MECIELHQKVPSGVNTFVWLLASYRGCKTARFISHNQHLTNFEGIKLPKERVIHPYISPLLVEQAVQRAGLTHEGIIFYERSKLKSIKEKLILIDNDVPHNVTNIIIESAIAAGGSSLYLDNLNASSILNAYERGKVVVDWCMRGSERCSLEAVLFGAIAITNICDTGSNFADFPIPYEFLIPHPDPNQNQLKDVFTQLFTKIFQEYWDILPLYEPLRHKILSHNPTTMTREAIRFLATIHIHENYTFNSLHPSGCIAC